ncbi:MAG: hypothetical protein KFF46_02855 [Desulfobacterales bacterium]|nr:hypothetical protein [Desulfobacterales bacterium]
MITIEKGHVSRLMLLEAYAEKHEIEEKLKYYRRIYNKTFKEFEKELKDTQTENFKHFDDYMEWKAYKKQMEELNARIEELKSANIKVA